MSDSISQIPPGSTAAEPQPESTAAPMGRIASPMEPRLRLWPAVVIVALQWIIAKGSSWFAPGTMIQFYAMFIGPMIGTAAFIAWWMFASRLRWRDRWLGLGAFAAAGAMAFLAAHSTVNPPMILVFVIPVVVAAWTVWLVVTPFLTWPKRRAGLMLVFVLAWGYFALVRFDGIDGSMGAALTFRWTKSPEEKFLAEIAERRNTTPAADSSFASAAEEAIELEPGDWPGFRGPDRDARLPGVRIATNWAQHPPREVWRHRVGPGWSSFAVVGHRLYTQEQLGEEEAVICYDTASGGELWVHRDAARFNEMMAGPGPRSTPTFHEGMIYALGAKGNLNGFDAATGRVVWSRDIVADSGAKIPIWGFAASPLIAEGVVTVFAGSSTGKSVLGYSAETGEPVWSAGEGEFGYCSTQLSRLDGVEQLLIATELGLAAFEPAGGTVLWNYSWPLEGGMSRVIQPAVVGSSDVIIGTGFGIGTQRVHVTRDGDAWTARAVWPIPTRAIKPYYNDLVTHGDHIYGFDGNLFTCVSLADGKGKWKARGYGNGQVLLLPDQDLLLILSETGEVALVAAKSDAHHELAKFKAIEGKTWNHPVVAHGKLFVRNGEEAACFELAEENEEGVASNDF